MRTARQTRSCQAGWRESSGLRNSGRVLWIEGRPRCGRRGGLAEAELDGVVAADCNRRTALLGQHGGRRPSGDVRGGRVSPGRRGGQRRRSGPQAAGFCDGGGADRGGAGTMGSAAGLVGEERGGG